MIIQPGRGRASAFLAAVEEEVGTGAEPEGLCSDRNKHNPHLYESATLGTFWCTANQNDREPYRSERRRSRDV